MSHVFVSYARKDSETVDQIVARLNRDGLDVWLDREDIKGGELWHVEIVEAIDNAYACVLMLSPASMASDNVRKEVDLAEGANKDLLPVLLASVELPLPAKLRYQLAGIQWIEYYRDPEAKYAELAEVLHARKPKQITSETQMMRDVEIVIKGLNPSKFGPEEQEKLLRFAAEITGTSRTDVELTALTAGSVHAFINMPAAAAYRLKTAALNRDVRLINYGIDALRLTGDRNFVLLKTGSIAPLKSGKSGSRSWLIGGLALVIALLLSSIFIPGILPNIRFFATATPTPTNTFTPTPSYTPTSTNTFTPTLTWTPTSTPTSTPTPTETPTFTPTVTKTPTITVTPTPNPPTTFVDPSVKPNHFGCISGTNYPVTISEIVLDQSGVSSVEIYFRLANKKNGTTTNWSHLPLTYFSGGFLGAWRRTIYSTDISGQEYGQEYWFQFYFRAKDSAGAIAQSPTYGDIATFASCAPPPPPT